MPSPLVASTNPAAVPPTSRPPSPKPGRGRPPYSRLPSCLHSRTSARKRAQIRCTSTSSSARSAAPAKFPEYAQTDRKMIALGKHPADDLPPVTPGVVVHLERLVGDRQRGAREVDAVLQRRHQAFVPPLHRQTSEGRRFQPRRGAAGKEDVTRVNLAAPAAREIRILHDGAAAGKVRPRERAPACESPHRPAARSAPSCRPILRASSCAPARRSLRARRRARRRVPVAACRSVRANAAGRTPRKIPGAARPRRRAWLRRPRPAPARRSRSPLGRPRALRSLRPAHSL